MEIQVRVQHNIGNVITISNNVAAFAKTYLTSNYAPAVTVIDVSNSTDFSASSLGLISTIGAENAEFVTISSVPSNTSLAVSATKFSHNRGEQVTYADYDSILVFKSSTIDGTYTQLGGNWNIQATANVTIINDASGLTTDYYKVQLRNSVTGNLSSLSEPSSPELFVSESVGAMFDSVKQAFGISPNDTIITTEFLLNSLNEARQFVDDTMANFKQSWREKFEYPIQLRAGWNSVELPEDYDYIYTNSKLLAARYPRINGLAPYPLTYIDKREWNATAYSLKYSYTVGTTLIGATSIQVENIGDFTGFNSPSQTGTIFIATNSLSEQIMQVNYTGINLATNTFTGCTGVTRNVPAGTQFFAFPTFTSATFYTVFEDYRTGRGLIVFNRPIPDIMQGRNLYVDYYKKMSPVTDINHVLEEPYRGIYRYYIRYAIKYRRDNATTVSPNNPSMDPDYKRFTELLKEWIENHYIGQTQKIITR